MHAEGLVSVLLVRIGVLTAALPVTDLVETCRPLPIEAVPGAPSFVLGLSIIRAAPVPVLDLGQLLGNPGPNAIARFVTVRAVVAFPAWNAVMSAATFAPGDS